MHKMPASTLESLVVLESSWTSFTINSLDPRHARILPILFQDKISLPLRNKDGAHLLDETRSLLITSLKRFVTISGDYGVAPENITIVASPGVTQIDNFESLRSEVKSQLKLNIHALDRRTENKVYVHGLAAAFHHASGLFVDMKFSSTTFNWIDAKDEIRSGDREVSIPFGFGNLAPVMEADQDVQEAKTQEIAEAVRQAMDSLDIPPSLTNVAERRGGHKLYICGVGVRSLTYWLLCQHPRYPVSLASGFAQTPERLCNDWASVDWESFKRNSNMSETTRLRTKSSIFLAYSIYEALPSIRKILYTENNMRDGILFNMLPSNITAQDPIIVATAPYALPGALKLTSVLRNALPSNTPEVISQRLALALSNASYIHSSYPREVQSNASMLVATSGVLAAANGISHTMRALLGLALSNRWGGETTSRLRPVRKAFLAVPPERELAWWALYLGHVMHLVGGAYPGAHVRPGVIDLSVKNETERGFTLSVVCHKDNVFGHNPIVQSRIDKLPVKIEALAAEFAFTVPEVVIEVVSV